MYKVFLADDNELSRKSVKNSVSWKKSGCKISGEADNGLAAYQMIMELKPDIALLDIKMPGLSGLDVAKKLKEEGMDCLIVLITAYDEFAFAREGLKLGVFDYLLKPVSEDELQEVIRKAVAKLKESGQKNEGIEIRKLLNKSILGSAEAAEKLMQELSRDWRAKEYCLMLISFQKNIADSEVKDILETCGSRLPVCLLDAWDQEGLVLLCLFQEVLISRDYNLTALKAANFIIKRFEEQGTEAVISISETGRKAEELQKLFKHTVFSKNSRFFLENQSIIHYDSLRSRSIQNEYKMMEYFEDFLSDCRSGSGNMTESLDAFLEVLEQDKSYDAEYIRSLLIQTGIMMTCSMGERGIGRAQKSVNDIMRELTDCKSIQEAFAWLRAYAQELGGVYAENQNYSLQTRRILEYLNDNYHKHLTLQDVSEAMNLSNAHVCRLLKNDTGETFVTLLNKIRIQESIRLLKEGELKVYEVADHVGFSNYAYFYQLFKKETGCSPTDFKE